MLVTKTYCLTNTALLVILVYGWFLPFVSGILFTNDTVPGYQKWVPENTTREYMYCPDQDFLSPGERRKRCPCSARPCWEFMPAACGDDVEFQTLWLENKPKNIVIVVEIGTGNITNATTVLHSLHNNFGRLQEVPSNICRWNDSLIILDISDNYISDISRLKCMKKLDTLILDNNNIVRVSNDTFKDMEFLRVFSIRNNHITKLDPNTLSISSGNIFVVDFSNNDILTADISDVFRLGPFCNLSCNRCNLGDITNKNNFRVGENTVIGPGALQFQNSHCDLLFNEDVLKGIGINDYNEWPKYFVDGGSIRLDAATIACDCKIHSFLSGLGSQAHKYWPNLLEDGVSYICESPEQLAGTNLTDLYLTGDYSELVCDMMECPYPCRCQDRPYDGHVLVNCSGSSLTHFPSYMPTGVWGNSDVILMLNDNSITTIEKKEYMSRVVDLDLQGNVITDISPIFASEININMKLDLSEKSSSPLRLPVSFSQLNPLAVNFGENTLLCNCDSIWIRDWVVIHKAFQTIRCTTLNGIRFAEDISETFLDCEEAEDRKTITIIAVLSAVVTLLVVMAVCLRVFRYEIYLLKRKLWKTEETIPKRFDVMLSFADENPAVSSFVHTYLGPELAKSGYSVFARFFHVLPGLCLGPEELLLKAAAVSRNYVVIICPNYLKDDSTVEEFNIIWNKFCEIRSSKLIVINFDTIATSEVSDRRLKAFLRLRFDLNYKSRYGSTMGRLKHQLGLPQKKSVRNNDNDISVTDSETEINEIKVKPGLNNPLAGETDKRIAKDESQVHTHSHVDKSIGCRRCYKPEPESANTLWLRERFQRHVNEWKKHEA